MNRVFVFGVAMFIAIVGIALWGGAKRAIAGLSCSGCRSTVVCGEAGDCGALAACPGRKSGHAGHHGVGRIRRCGGCEGQRLLGRRQGGGPAADCCGQPVSCCGTVVVDARGVVAEPAPPEVASEEPVGTVPVEEGATHESKV